MSKFNAPNSIFSNWDKDLYIANKEKEEFDDYNNNFPTYKKPFFFGKVNYQPLTGKNLEAYMKAFGETQNSVISALIDYTDDGKFKSFDLAYLYGTNPNGEKVYGENANYIVKAYKPQNTKIMVLFEEIVKEDNNGNS